MAPFAGRSLFSIIFSMYFFHTPSEKYWVVPIILYPIQFLSHTVKQPLLFIKKSDLEETLASPCVQTFKLQRNEEDLLIDHVIPKDPKDPKDPTMLPTYYSVIEFKWENSKSFGF